MRMFKTRSDWVPMTLRNFDQPLLYVASFSGWLFPMNRLAHVVSFILSLWFSCSVTSDSFATPWTISHQAPLSKEFSRQGYWSGLPFLSPGDAPDPGIEPTSPALQADSLPLSHQGRPSFILARGSRQWRVRWLDVITVSMDMSLRKLWEMVKDREAWRVSVHAFAKSRTQLSD